MTHVLKINGKEMSVKDFQNSKDLYVRYDLYLSGTQIAQLPEGLHVGGSLYLEGTQIAQLPEGLHVGGYLDLRGTQIAQLPEGLHVGGSLDLRGTQIAQLPEGLHVGGSLDLGPYEVSFPEEGKMKIGCQHHSISAWESFTDNEIAAMDRQTALRFWRKWKVELVKFAKCQAQNIKRAAE